MIWRFAAKVKADGARAALDDVQLALGNTDRQTILTGAGDVEFGQREQSRRLCSRPGNSTLTGCSRARTRASSDAEATIRNLVDLAGSGQGGRSWLSGELEISAGTMLFGGETVQAPRFSCAPPRGGRAVAHASAELPGRTVASFDGTPRPDALLAGGWSSSPAIGEADGLVSGASRRASIRSAGSGLRATCAMASA